MNALRALRPLATRVPAGLRAKSTLPASTTLKTAAPLTVLSDELARAAGVSSELSKARLSGFVAMTCSMGFAATGAPVLTADAALATYGVFATSACANTLNQIYEIPRDSRMARTAHRPLPSGRCSTPEALAFAGVTSVSGVAALATLSPTAAALAAANIGLYSGAYTMMKPRSEWNTWVGAAVGAVPPLIGWAAAGGPSSAAARPTRRRGFPHFFALAWVHKADYAKGGFAMVPVRDKAGHRTASLIGRYAVYSTALPVLAYATGATSAMFALEGTALNAALLAAAAKFHGQRTTANARLVFRATLLYLPLILFFFVLHSTRLKDEGDADARAPPTLGDAKKTPTMVRASGLALRLAVAVAACALVVRGDEFDAPTPRPAASPAKKPSASDGADPVSDEIWTTMTISATAFVALSLLFDLLRSHLWWVYGPRLHHAKYRAATPPDPGPGPFRWVAAVARLWSDAEFLEYAGVDGLVMIQFLNFAADQAFFAALVGCAVLVPTYVTARGLRDAADDDDASYGFSLTTVSNIHCAKKDALGKQPLFPKCLNQNSNWRFAVVVAGALFTLRALSRLSVKYRNFVRLRHWYLTSRLGRRASPRDAQHSLTVLVENVPLRYRSRVALQRKFDRLCGPGSVDSVHVMVGGLEHLNGLVGRRDRARAKLEDARSRRARLAALREGDYRARAPRRRRRPTRRRRRRGGALARPGVGRAVAAAVARGAGAGDVLDLARPRLPALDGEPRRQRDAPALDGVPEEGRESGDDHLELSDRSSSGTADRSEPPELLEDDPGSVGARSQVDEVEALALDGFRDARRLSEDMESAAEAAGRRRTWSREMWRARAVPDPVPRHVPRYGTLFNAFYGCCCGAFDGCFVESIPFYEQTVDALNREILRAHFAHMLLAERTSKPRLRALIGEKKRRNHGWRGCFWAIDDDDFSSDSDDDEPAAALAPAPATPAAGAGDDAAPTPTPAAAAASARRRNRRLSHLQASGALRRGGDDRRESVDPVAKYRDRHWLSVLASDPPSQAVPAVARRVALSARKVVPFAMRATDAPEPRDVLWDNVFVGRGSVLRRQWVVAGGVFTLMLFWFTVVTWCSSTTRLVTLIFDWDVEDEGLVERSTYQFINVYVSILANAILKDLQKAWHSPVTFVLTIGQKTPDAALYFAKLLIFQCGTSPLWSLRAWPLLSRGFKTWTVQPPELPAMLYGWAFPKVMMTFTIFCTFWVFAPLVSVFAFVYFVLISFQFRYLILFCHMPVYESGGMFFYRVVERVLFGLATSNVILALWLLFQQMVGDALLVAPLPFVVLTFRYFCREAYADPSLTMSLDEACYAQPALKHQGLPPSGPQSPGDRVHEGVAAKRRASRSGDGAAALFPAPPPPRAARRRTARAAARAAAAAASAIDAAARDVAEQVVQAASREDRARVLTLLESAYRGEHDFFAVDAEASQRLDDDYEPESPAVVSALHRQHTPPARPEPGLDRV
ncbi:hypothetical protein JL720_7243 [Aureococcus anophagefferens]|nr:hypothetical protein JL720_7243 [Aureococcus anophagefferens]